MKLLSISILITLAFGGYISSIYSLSVPKAEGGSQPLSAYQNKKMLIVVLPAGQNAFNDSMLYSLDTLAAAHLEDLQVIAVPSFEDGYTLAQQTELQHWYRSKLDSHIIITAGLYTHRFSAEQHPLFHWLTNVSENEHFNMDVEGAGHKFFVNGNGKLYGVLSPATKMWSGAVQKTLRQ